MGFDLSQLLRTDHLQPGESVRLAAAPQFLEAGKFLLVRGHDDFAADLVGDVVRAAKFDHGARTLDT
jgi:hypothetical protein